MGKHYYLVNGTVKVSDSKMPEKRIVQHKDYNQKFEDYKYKTFYDNWLFYLQPCDIDESEIMKIYVHLFPNLSYNKQDATPIDITDIVRVEELIIETKSDIWTDCKIYFKQPTEKQVYSDAVEFAEWIHINAQPRLPNKNQWKMYNNSVVITTQELYEIFKNR